MSARCRKCPDAPAQWRPVGEVAAGLTDAAGRAVIVRLLKQAGQGDARAFQEADQIRQCLGLTWDDLLARAA